MDDEFAKAVREELDRVIALVGKRRYFESLYPGAPCLGDIVKYGPHEYVIICLHREKEFLTLRMLHTDELTYAYVPISEVEFVAYEEL